MCKRAKNHSHKPLVRSTHRNREVGQASPPNVNLGEWNIEDEFLEWALSCLPFLCSYSSSILPSPENSNVGTMWPSVMCPPSSQFPIPVLGAECLETTETELQTRRVSGALLGTYWGSNTGKDWEEGKWVWCQGQQRGYKSVLGVSTSIALKRFQSWPAHIQTGENLLE